MIKIKDASGKRCSEGIAVARQLIRKRVPDAVLAEILGPEAESRAEQMIEWSGGYPRDLVRMMRSAIEWPHYPLSQFEFERIRNDIWGSSRRVVPQEAFDWLASVAATHSPTLQDDEHREAADKMFSNNVVLRYANNEDWFDLHPAIHDLPGIVSALERLRQKERNG